MSALGKVAVYENPLYKRSGLKSYAWVLAKCELKALPPYSVLA